MMARDTNDPVKLLDLNRDKLVRDIFHVGPIVDRLFATDFVTEQEKNTIIGGQGDDRHSRAGKLLDVVRSKGLDAFFCFREVLRGYCPYSEELLRHCPKHNSKFMFWCNQCECLQCEYCKAEHVQIEHDFTAIFSITENIKAKFDSFIRESRLKLSCVRNRKVSSTELHEFKLWAKTSGVELRALVSRAIEEEENWFVTKLRNQGTPSVSEQGPVNTGVLERGRLSDRTAVGQVAVRRKYEDAIGLRTLLTSNYDELVKDMKSINPIINSLYQEGIIKEEEKCGILQESRIPQDQARRLLDVIACKGTIEALHHFVKALETTYPHLAELLHQCPKHNKKFELYCEDCKELICEDCRDSQHSGHYTTSITTIVAMCQSEFDRFIQDNRETIMDIRHQKTDPEGQEKRVKERQADLHDMITRKIQEEVNMLISNLDQSSSNSIVVSLRDTTEGKGSTNCIKKFRKIAKFTVLSAVSTMLILLAYAFI
uniref:B box-type domain-containing protein n=1 Tax=Branchiostoma floridae TaxID=7739 RepID=C3Z5N9_BRAFL|eukprot:XP_002596140.1 hypothetical protein BRAFLDRAFT_66131 [Branchiostoma floridae]